MNLTVFFTDDEILKGFHLVQTLEPGQARQICFACEKPLVTPNHYRAQITGASGALLGVQVCIDCQLELYRAAHDRRRLGKPSPLQLTEQERTVAPPQPIQLDSIFAPRRQHAATAASRAAEAIQEKEDLFDAVQ